MSETMSSTRSSRSAPGRIKATLSEQATGWRDRFNRLLGRKSQDIAGPAAMITPEATSTDQRRVRFSEDNKARSYDPNEPIVDKGKQKDVSAESNTSSTTARFNEGSSSSSGEGSSGAGRPAGPSTRPVLLDDVDPEFHNTVLASVSSETDRVLGRWRNEKPKFKNTAALDKALAAYQRARSDAPLIGSGNPTEKTRQGVDDRLGRITALQAEIGAVRDSCNPLVHGKTIKLLDDMQRYMTVEKEAELAQGLKTAQTYKELAQMPNLLKDVRETVPDSDASFALLDDLSNNVDSPTLIGKYGLDQDAKGFVAPTAKSGDAPSVNVDYESVAALQQNDPKPITQELQIAARHYIDQRYRPKQRERLYETLNLVYRPAAAAGTSVGAASPPTPAAAPGAQPATPPSLKLPPRPRHKAPPPPASEPATSEDENARRERDIDAVLEQLTRGTPEFPEDTNDTGSSGADAANVPANRPGGTLPPRPQRRAPPPPDSGDVRSPLPIDIKGKGKMPDQEDDFGRDTAIARQAGSSQTRAYGSQQPGSAPQNKLVASLMATPDPADRRKIVRNAVQTQPSDDAYLGNLAKELVTEQVAKEMKEGRGMKTFMRSENAITDFVKEYMTESASGAKYAANLQQALAENVRRSVKNVSFVLDPLSGKQTRNEKQGVRIVVALVKQAIDRVTSSALPSPLVAAARQIAAETRKAGLPNKEIAVAIGSLIWLRAALPVFSNLDKTASLPKNQQEATGTATKILMKIGFGTGNSLAENQPSLKPVIDQLKGYSEKLENWFLTVGGITQ